MLKIHSTGAKALKMLHLAAIAIWIGGAASWLPMLAGTDFNNYGATYASYLNMRTIAWNVIGWGGIFSLVSGLLNGLLTEWRLFKYRWTMVKLFVIIGQIALGMFFIENKLLANISILENENTVGMTSDIFQANHAAIKGGIVAQLFVWLCVIAISIYKPWGLNRTRA